MNRINSPNLSPVMLRMERISTHSTSHHSTTDVATRSINQTTPADLQKSINDSGKRLIALQRLLYVIIALTATIAFVAGHPIAGSIVVALLVCYMIKTYLDDRKIEKAAKRALSEL